MADHHRLVRRVFEALDSDQDPDALIRAHRAGVVGAILLMVASAASVLL